MISLPTATPHSRSAENGRLLSVDTRVCSSLSTITLDHQHPGLVDEVEVADRHGAVGQGELETVACPGAGRRIKGTNAQDVAFAFAASAYSVKPFGHSA